MFLGKLFRRTDDDDLVLRLHSFPLVVLTVCLETTPVTFPSGHPLLSLSSDPALQDQHGCPPQTKPGHNSFLKPSHSESSANSLVCSERSFCCITILKLHVFGHPLRRGCVEFPEAVTHTFLSPCRVFSLKSLSLFSLLGLLAFSLGFFLKKLSEIFLPGLVRQIFIPP